MDLFEVLEIVETLCLPVIELHVTLSFKPEIIPQLSVLIYNFHFRKLLPSLGVAVKLLIQDLNHFQN